MALSFRTEEERLYSERRHLDEAKKEEEYGDGEGIYWRCKEVVCRAAEAKGAAILE